MNIYHTETQADYDTLMVELEKRGYKWESGAKPTELNMWHYRKSDSTVKVSSSDKLINMTVTAKKEQEYNFDIVDKPKHYIGIHGLEVETVLENFLPKITDGYVAHRIGSAIEYILRHPEKNGRQDLEKAKKNLEQVFSYLEREAE